MAELSGEYVLNGVQVLVTQGREGYKLIEGKPTLFRCFLPPGKIAQLVRLTVAVNGGSIEDIFSFDVPLNVLIDERSSPRPSVGFVLDGKTFTHAGHYIVEIRFAFADSSSLALTFQPLQFEKTHDLRILFSLDAGAVGGLGQTTGWSDDIKVAVSKVSALLPIREGVRFGFVDTVLDQITCLEGLRYRIGPSMTGHSEPVRVQELARTMEIQNARQPLGDHADLAILYSRRSRTEANKPRVAKSQVHRVGIVRGGTFNSGYSRFRDLTPGLFVQAVAWLFFINRAPPNSSILPYDPEAFDFVRLRRFSSPVGNAMFLDDNNPDTGVWLGSGHVQLSADDWNTLVDPNLWDGIIDNPTGPNEQGPRNRFVCQGPGFLVAGGPEESVVLPPRSNRALLGGAGRHPPYREDELRFEALQVMPPRRVAAVLHRARASSSRYAHADAVAEATPSLANFRSPRPSTPEANWSCRSGPFESPIQASLAIERTAQRVFRPYPPSVPSASDDYKVASRPFTARPFAQPSRGVSITDECAGGCERPSTNGSRLDFVTSWPRKPVI